MTTIDLVLAFIAVCGLGLSIYNTWQAQKSKKTSLSLIEAKRTQGKLGDVKLRYTIMNIGEVPAIITAIHCTYGRKKPRRRLSVNCSDVVLHQYSGTARWSSGIPNPIELLPGQTRWFEIYKDSIENCLWENNVRLSKVFVKLSLRDATGNTHSSKQILEVMPSDVSWHWVQDSTGGMSHREPQI